MPLFCHKASQALCQMIWQASMQSGFLSSGNDNRSMTFQKLYDVAFSLTDVLAVSSVFSDPFAPAPAEYITQFLSLLSSFRNGANKRFLPSFLPRFTTSCPTSSYPRYRRHPSHNRRRHLRRLRECGDGRYEPAAPITAATV